MAKQERIRYTPPKEDSRQYEYTRDDAHDQLSKDARTQEAQRKAGKLATDKVIEISDELLDEIDTILEDTEIVTSYVAQGGQ